MTADRSADIGVVVVTYNSAEVIGGLLDGLPAACGGLTAEVVLVDNGSADGTADLAQRRGDCTVVRSTNLGYSAGINQGLAALGAVPAVLVLNPDVRLDPDAVPRMLSALGAPGVGIVAPRILDPQGRLDLSLRRDPTLLRALGLGRTGWALFSEYVTDPEAYDRPHPVDWALGAVLLVSAECLQAVGPWDESFFLYSEETDYCLRARRSGFATRYEPSAVATHIGGASGRNDLTHTMQIVNRVRFYARNHPRPLAWLYWGVTLLSELSWVWRGHRQSRAAIRVLLRPSLRPAVLNCSRSLLPR